MNKETILRSTITPHFTLVIDKEDDTEPEKWKLCLDYNAIAKVEAETGRDLKKLQDWQNLPSAIFPTVVWCLLSRYNSNVSIDQVKEILNPNAQSQLENAIFELAFPGAIEAMQKDIAEKENTGASNSPKDETKNS